MSSVLIRVPQSGRDTLGAAAQWIDLMLLANRRTTLLYLCLAGMEAAWITPFWLLIFTPAPLPWTAYAGVLAGLLIWTLTIELMSRTRLQSPAYDLTVLALMAITSLLIVWAALYRAAPVSNVGWLRRMLGDIFNFSAGLPPAVGLIAINLVLWQRATSATSRDPSFFNVGVSFRLGMLLLIAGAGLLSFLRGQSVLGFLWLYFALGLIAVSIARISEKASEAQSAGKALPVRRFAQLLLAAGVTIGAAWLLSTVFTPAGIRRLFHLFDPVWRLVSPLAFALLMVIGQVLNPLLLWFEAQLLRLLRTPNLSGAEIAPVAPTGTQPSFFEGLPAWVPNLLFDVLVIVGIIVAALAVAGFLLLYLERVRKGGLRDGDEEEGAERVGAGRILERGARVLRNAAGLIRRLGLGPHLLAAISVQNIYANVCRLARDRGYPRRPAQPPDDYLPVLVRALGGFEDQLARITAAYMRVHYGDHPVARAELAQLREDYRAVQDGEEANQRMSE